MKRSKQYMRCKPTRNKPLSYDPKVMIPKSNTNVVIENMVHSGTSKRSNIVRNEGTIQRGNKPSGG